MNCYIGLLVNDYLTNTIYGSGLQKLSKLRDAIEAR
jgi:hypothetical protein